jgi:hypothetical protein
MRSWQLMLAATVALVSGCAGSHGHSGAASPERGGKCGLDYLNQPADVMSEPEVEEVSEDAANLVVDLSSSTTRPVRVTVRLNGRVALDVRTPSVPAECSHSPVYSHGFHLPEGPAHVTVATDRGQRRSITVPLHGPTHWVAVQPQDGFPIGLDVFDEEPQWG